MSTTASEPAPASHPDFFGSDADAPALEPRPERVASRPSRASAVVWVDSIFYAAVTVFVSSLVAYFLLD